MTAEPYPEQCDESMGECGLCEELVMWSIAERRWIHTLTWDVACVPVRRAEMLLTGQEP
jgi:hypothetical protein